MPRLKPKYNATPTPRERRYHRWLINAFPCVCCGAVSGVVHHPLTRHPEQRWRRDHEFVVPMDGFCHMALHQCGNEQLWKPDLRLDELAWQFRADGYDRGHL